MTREQSRLGFYLEIEISLAPSADLEFSFRRFSHVKNSTFSLPIYGPCEMDRGKESWNWKDERDVRDTEKFQGSNP